MRLLLAATAAFGIGLASSSSQAEAVAFPVILDFNFCWGAQTCAYPPGIVYFQVESNGTFTVSDGFTGTWQYVAARRQVRLSYAGGSPIYIGTIRNGCVTNGYMDVGGAPQGSWSGCVR